MNLKIRVKNWGFWLSVIISVFAPILAYFGITVQDLTSWSILGDMIVDAVSNPYVVGLILISVYNTLVDPTTKGIKDSARAMGYNVPGGEE